MIKISNNFKGTTAIVLASLFWGLEFVVEKDVLSHIEPNWSNAIRFSIASIFCIIFWWNKVNNSSRNDWLKGLLSGAAMGLGYAFQTMGLESINAGINAFLSAAYIVIIPFLVWFIEKQKPTNIVFISAIIAIVGVSIMSLNAYRSGSVTIGVGELLTLIGSVFYALGIVSVDYYAKTVDCFLLATIQCISTFGVSIILALILEDTPSYFDTTLMVEFTYLVIFASIITQILFTYGMKHVTSHRASILFLLESVSAVIFGRMFLNEKIKKNQIIGALFIIISIILTNRNTDGE